MICTQNTAHFVIIVIERVWFYDFGRMILIEYMCVVIQKHPVAYYQVTEL